MREGLAILSTVINSQLYLTGAAPVAADAAVFSLLDQLFFDFCSAEDNKRVAIEFENLVRYTVRIREKYYPEAPVFPIQAELDLSLAANVQANQ